MSKIKALSNLLLVSASLLVSFASVSYAHKSIVVIPLFDEPEVDKTIFVIGGENPDFANISEALNFIEDASAFRRYQLVIRPGIYELVEPIQMKPYIDIVGSGVDETTLRGTIGASSFSSAALIIGADEATLRSLSVENLGGNGPGQSVSVGFYNFESSPKIIEVKISASGASVINVGMFNLSASPVISSTSFNAVGGQNSIGIVNNMSPAIFIDIDSHATGASNENVAISNTQGDVEQVFIRANAVARGGAKAYAVHNLRSKPIFTSLQTESSEATLSHGMFNNLESNVLLKASNINGSTTSISSVAGSVTSVLNSSINDGFDANGELFCIESQDGAMNALDINCEVLGP